MKKTNRETNWRFLSTGMAVCLAMRLVPFRAPNVEPIFATQMPFAKAYGGFIGFLFGFSSIVVYDLLTGTGGMWTLVTGVAYGTLGLFSAYFLKNREASRKNFFILAVIGTLFYDAVTGFTIGPILFHQSFVVALIGQIPFTALHLFGNIIFSLLVSPAIYTFLLKHQKLREAPSTFALSTKPITN